MQLVLADHCQVGVCSFAALPLLNVCERLVYGVGARSQTIKSGSRVRDVEPISSARATVHPTPSSGTWEGENADIGALERAGMEGGPIKAVGRVLG